MFKKQIWFIDELVRWGWYDGHVMVKWKQIKNHSRDRRDFPFSGNRPQCHSRTATSIKLVAHFFETTSVLRPVDGSLKRLDQTGSLPASEPLFLIRKDKAFGRAFCKTPFLFSSNSLLGKPYYAVQRRLWIRPTMHYKIRKSRIRFRGAGSRSYLHLRHIVGRYKRTAWIGWSPPGRSTEQPLSCRRTIILISFLVRLWPKPGASPALRERRERYWH